MESFYYAYRATKDPKYQKWAWNAYVAINSTCRVGSGYAELHDVNSTEGGGFVDMQDSFLLAEVLKYAYLIQALVSSYAFR
jgi:mannosyl-oligosaccharide alpha-1,2-mannosidase